MSTKRAMTFILLLAVFLAVFVILDVQGESIVTDVPTHGGPNKIKQVISDNNTNLNVLLVPIEHGRATNDWSIAGNLIVSGAVKYASSQSAYTNKAHRTQTVNRAMYRIQTSAAYTQYVANPGSVDVSNHKMVVFHNNSATDTNITFKDTGNLLLTGDAVLASHDSLGLMAVSTSEWVEVFHTAP